ncbi:F0F1 ATP synthase subunit B' [Litorivita sp. NS0012-18]|uniref:F0F1 ATP synthase subunit B' n=1 Tax=Litorivita sp. NS0012-18 TaxID=3127655 RepID=UPI0031035E0A
MATETHEATTHSAATDGAAAATHNAADAAPGMPQLDFTTFSNQIFWLLVALVVIYIILSRFALPRIAAVLAERQGTITNDIAAAEELKAKAVEAEAAYNQALADARVDASNIIAATKVEIQAELDKAIAKADTEIAAKTAEGEKAIAEIRASATDAVKAVSKDVAKDLIASMGAKADAKTVTAAVTARMKG